MGVGIRIGYIRLFCFCFGGLGCIGLDGGFRLVFVGEVDVSAGYVRVC